MGVVVEEDQMSTLSAFVGGYPDAKAGDIPICGNGGATGVGTSGTTYTELVRIYLPVGGAFRIKVEAKGYGYVRIYRNWAPIGTENRVSGTFVLFSEDISGWSKGDMLSIYAKADTGEIAYLYKFSLNVDDPILAHAFIHYGFNHSWATYSPAHWMKVSNLF